MACCVLTVKPLPSSMTVSSSSFPAMRISTATSVLAYLRALDTRFSATSRTSSASRHIFSSVFLQLTIYRFPAVSAMKLTLRSTSFCNSENSVSLEQTFLCSTPDKVRMLSTKCFSRSICVIPSWSMFIILSLSRASSGTYSSSISWYPCNMARGVLISWATAERSAFSSSIMCHIFRSFLSSSARILSNSPHSLPSSSPEV